MYLNIFLGSHIIEYMAAQDPSCSHNFLYSLPYKNILTVLSCPSKLFLLLCILVLECHPLFPIPIHLVFLQIHLEIYFPKCVHFEDKTLRNVDIKHRWTAACYRSLVHDVLAVNTVHHQLYSHYSYHIANKQIVRPKEIIAVYQIRQLFGLTFPKKDYQIYHFSATLSMRFSFLCQRM